MQTVWGHDMKIRQLATIAVFAAGLAAGAVQAQETIGQPAELPPESYKGKQYVDSSGCVFIRGGIDGAVTWVPRLSRAREAVCGFKPTLAESAAAAPVAAEAAVVTAAVEEEAPAPVAAATQRPVTKPVAKPIPQAVRKAATRPAPRSTKVVRSTPIRRPAPVAAPQAQVIRVQATVADTIPPAPIVVGPHTRIVPKHVAYNRLNTRNVTVPHGYRRVWEDGRLNPHRAEQNLAGRSDMLLIWTQTVPRRLIDQRTGRDVTTSVPLVYPYIDVITQSRELGKVEIVQRDGRTVKRVIPVKTAPRKPVYSSRSQQRAEAPAPQPAAVGRFVQVGSFGDAENAQRAARQIANMGLPARIAKSTSGGRQLLVVQAGPLAASTAVQSAVARLRAAGYRDAFVR
jgi:hypothetical protein